MGEDRTARDEACSKSIDFIELEFSKIDPGSKIFQKQTISGSPPVLLRMCASECDSEGAAEGGGGGLHGASS